MEVIYSANKLEQINDYLFIDIYKVNKVQIGMNEMWVNDSEMSMRWKRGQYPRYQSWDSKVKYIITKGLTGHKKVHTVQWNNIRIKQLKLPSRIIHIITTLFKDNDKML